MTTRERGKTRKFWGWGFEEDAPDASELAPLRMLAGARFGLELPDPPPPPRIEDIELRAPRLAFPSAVAPMISTTPMDRASHTHGKAFRDVVRGLAGDFQSAPDGVARPANEDELTRLLEWCSTEDIAAVPYGGGSSVVGGIEAPRDTPRVLSIDLSRFDQVLELDTVSRAARIQGGIFGPALENVLRPEGFTLRHFPQSFEFSTLGGWLATRAGGHYATVLTHIDDFVESMRVVTPTGTLESRRLPGSGAGPSPDRMFVGSEGMLGIITEAWMRITPRPTFRASASISYPDFLAGARAVRALAQSGLRPANCRLLDPIEALLNGAGDGNALLILGFESADHPLDTALARGIEIAREHGGTVLSERMRSEGDEQDETREDASGAWRRSFLRAPYMRDALTAMGLITETFETAITWDAFEEFHARVTAAVRDALERVCGGGEVTCRFTHVYPDGPAPYFTVLAPARPGSALEQWDEIKAAASETLIADGGTITHHHAVGRDHRPWYDRQRPEAFARALRAAKRELDPAGILNPGVLIDP